MLLTAMLASCATRYAEADSAKTRSETTETTAVAVISAGADGLWTLSDGQVLTTILTDCDSVSYQAAAGLLVPSYPEATYGYSERTTARTPSLTQEQLRQQEHALFATVLFELGSKTPEDAAYLGFRLQTYHALRIPSAGDTAVVPVPTCVDCYTDGWIVPLDGRSAYRLNTLASSAYTTDITCYLIERDAKTVLSTCFFAAQTLRPKDTLRLDISALLLPSARIAIDTTYADTIYYTTLS